jgi:two-component system, cell cycle sensor histidine kinase and response regulator CckA
MTVSTISMSPSRQTRPSRALLSLSSVIRDALPVVRAAIANAAVLRIAMDEQAPLVEADPTAMQRVLLELVLNASKAIRQPHGVIEIGVVGMTGSNGHSHPFVRLTVADNGIGMDGASVGNLRQQLVEPAPSHGVGLGLRIVHRAVYAHGGRLLIESQPGNGTTIRVDLPAVSQPAGARGPDARKGDDRIRVRRRLT